jgi:hypothetical protein
LEGEGLTLHDLNPSSDEEEWSGLSPACFILLERAPDTHSLFFQDTLLYYPLIYAHLTLDLLAKIQFLFFIPCMYATCYTHFILHVIIKTPA